MYSLARPLLFCLEPERAHLVTLGALRAYDRVKASVDDLPAFFRLGFAPSATAPGARTIMGLSFPNPVGLAAGLDKNGEYIDGLARLGFGFLEVGTVTPRPQPGNPRPRMFRIRPARAIINRMGFNNHGVDHLVDNVKRARYRGVLGINIGKNFDTPLERAADDYVTCLRKVYSIASYVTVNISSPNTENLRRLQGAGVLDALLSTLTAERRVLAAKHGRMVPLAVKIAPDLDRPQVEAIAALLRTHAVDAVIATNTTVTREGIAGLAHENEAGGLSGAPLTARATSVVRQLAQALAGELPVIGVGGIMTAPDASERIAAGASLVQLYTGLVYRGPVLVRECIAALCAAPAANTGH